MGWSRLEPARAAAWGLNLALRGAIIGFTREALRARDDPRFAGKGLPVRHLVLAGSGLGLTAPVLHAWGHPWRRYPVGADTAILSVIALDMAANSLALYDRRWRFDLIPHAYGPFIGVTALRWLGVGARRSALVVNALQVLFEIQEAIGDAVFGTRNVRGWRDTIGDLSAGLVGSLALPLLVRRLGERAARRHRRGVPAYSAA